MTMTLVETITLTSSAASIEFTSIPQDGTDLVLLVSLRNSAGNSIHYLELNGDTTSGNYVSRMLTGNGANVYSYTLNKNMLLTTYSPDTANTFGNQAIYLPNYADSSSYQSISLDASNENNGTYVTGNAITAGVWNNNAAVTSIKLQSQDNWVAGSSASLYKITKAA